MRRGKRVPLTEPQADVLLELVSRAGEIVERAPKFAAARPAVGWDHEEAADPDLHGTGPCGG